MYDRAHKICSNKQSLNKQIPKIKTFMLWNGRPKQVQNSVIKQREANISPPRLTDDDDRKKIWLGLPCNGKQGEQLVTSLIKTLKH